MIQKNAKIDDVLSGPEPCTKTAQEDAHVQFYPVGTYNLKLTALLGRHGPKPF